MNIVKHLPNAVTLCNLLCGCLAIVFAMQGDFHASFILILFGAFFDFCDGLVARGLNAYSEIGKELDSLSDLVTFGVAPAILGLKFIILCDLSQWLCYIPLALALCGALRLAKFNIDENQKESFLGLPIPAAALLFSALILYLKLLSFETEDAVTYLMIEKWLVVGFAVVLSLLMVSKIPMFSFKFKNLSPRQNKTRFVFLMIAALEIAVILIFSNFFTHCLGFSFYGILMLAALALFVLIITYILFNLAVNLFVGRNAQTK